MRDTARWAALLAFALVGCGGSGGDSTEPSGGAGSASGGAQDSGGSGLGPDASLTDATPSACAASAEGDVPLGTDTPPSATRWKVTDAITFQNVGGTGSYDVVTNMAPGTWPPPCADPNACVKQAKTVTGPLVPFDEEMTIVLSGPIDLYAIGVYTPNGSDWARTSYWDRCGSDNLVFMNNKGGGNVSGVWTVCGGNSQSYASADGTAAAKQPTEFAGHLGDGVGVNVMSAALCGSDCGFYRDVGMHGFQGSADGTKIFAVKLRMPVGTVTPAYWILPAQVVRTAQYGCNCRGMGGQGGCGELDVAEVLTSDDPMAATTTIYSFKSVRNGNGSTFQRPALETATFIVIFDDAARWSPPRRRR
jgi:hypothetical protein